MSGGLGLRAASYPGKSGGVSANGVAARWWSGDATPLGLKIARTLTQGSLADSVAGLEDTIPLGLQNHRSLRRSARLIGIGSFARPLVLDAARVNGLAWLCWSAPETNPGGIGRQVCVATRRLRIRHWIYVPMYLARPDARAASTSESDTRRRLAPAIISSRRM